MMAIIWLMVLAALVWLVMRLGASSADNPNVHKGCCGHPHHTDPNSDHPAH